MAQFTLTLKPMYSSVTRPNLRAEPSRKSDGTAVNIATLPAPSNLPVLDVQPDREGETTFGTGRVFQWLQADFPTGRAWIRDDLCTVVGDGRAFGYGVISEPTHPIHLERGEPIKQDVATAGGSQGSGSSVSAGGASAPQPSDKAAFRLTLKPRNANILRPNIRDEPSRKVNRTPFDLEQNDTPTDLPVLDVQPDRDGEKITNDPDAKVFQWLQADFPTGRGWIRDDLCMVVGDGRAFGYGVISELTHPIDLVRSEAVTGGGVDDRTANAGVGAGTATANTDTGSSTTTKANDTTGSSGAASDITGGASGGDATKSGVDGGSQTASTENPKDDTKTQTTTSTGTMGAVSEGAQGGAAGSGVVVTGGMSGPPKAKAMRGARLRRGPGAIDGNPNYEQITVVGAGTVMDVLGAVPTQDGKPNWLYWVHVRLSNGQEGYIREDVLRLSGRFDPFGYNVPDKYPCPMENTRWSRGWDMDVNNLIWGNKHDGRDHAAAIGEPVLAGPQGGVVYKKMYCTQCGPEAKSVKQVLGTEITPSWVFTDDAWGDGYGHYLIVAYHHDKLPASTQQWIRDNYATPANDSGDGKYHVFTMYAHLSAMYVEQGQELDPYEKIGACGNSGNSFGAHVHLETRISPTMNPRSFWHIKDGRRSPGILFLR